MKKISLFLLLLLSLAACRKNTWDELSSGFRTPPDSIRIAAYWYWLDNDISKDGVLKDLEAMKSVGITRAFIGNQSAGIPTQDLDQHSILEGRRQTAGFRTPRASIPTDTQIVNIR